MGQSISIGASRPARRNPATKVVVRQWPWGTEARRRAPRGARPRSRAILVFRKVSSMKTSLSGSSPGCDAAQASRAAAMSGRVCLLAWPDFF